MGLLSFTSHGIYCEQADVYIDPWKPVAKALITHGHADHTRWGNKHYLCTQSAAPVIRYRLGSNIKLQSIRYGEVMTLNGVRFSFHPAGHILGSAQIRVEYKGEVWVASGDYKIEDDGLAEAYEPVKCHNFITESTFGLPIYKWKPQAEIFQSINQWWATNKAEGKVTVLTGYALGKAQRLLQGPDTDIGQIYTHGAIENTNEVIRRQGIVLPETIRVTPNIKKKDFMGNLVICPPSGASSSWVKKFAPSSIGVASGWMMLRGARRRRAADRGFVLSDHADWEGLLQAIAATEAECVYVTHGYTHLFATYLNEQGIEAYAVETQYEGELSEMNDSSKSEDDAAE